MSEYKQRRIPLLGQDSNALTWLIIINASVFIILNFLKIVYSLSDIPDELFQRQILNWYTLPASLEKLSVRPWVIFSSFFTHFSVFSLIGSLLWLWSFGYILQDLTGNQKLIPIYIYGGVVGAFFFVFTNNIFPALAKNIDDMPDMMGASACIMAVAVATTTLSPDYRIFPLINGGIPLWVLTIVFVAVDFASIGNGKAGIGMAHLAAGGMGFFYVKQLQKGNDLGAWMISFWQWLDDLFNPEKKHTVKKEKDRLFYKTNSKPFVKTPNLTQQKLDEILDKINREGYHFLTNEEKEFLKRASKEEL
ncbi:rhomboid family intramembrane serine protease [Parasediminibacterium paludis]|uniref:Rhomboid family intramembrane serine protease n=1 Tax=Parasediminibacterium paludis TaxID=908966 RepID=A0ABV8PVH3_9BACT